MKLKIAPNIKAHYQKYLQKNTFIPNRMSQRQK